MNADWYPLGIGINFRKWNIYDMDWDSQIQLEKFTVCGAPFGGPVGIIADSKRYDYGDLSQELKNKLMIFTSSGAKLSEVSWENEKHVIGMGWSDQEHLVTIQDNGAIKIFDIHGKSVSTFPLIDFNSGMSVNILDCHFWGNGVAVITSNLLIHVAEGLSASEIFTKKPRTYILKTGLGRERFFTSMAIVPPLLSRSGLLEVLVGTTDMSVLVIHESGVDGDNIIEDQLLQQRIGAKITKIAVAPNGKFLACYRDDGFLTVMSSAFTRKILDFETKSLYSPIQIAWCGEDAVVMQWRNTGVVMVGKHGDWLNFPYDVDVHLVAEPDCCRIISSIGCEILQLVPPSTVKIDGLGSTDPAALMYDAMETFEQDEIIRSIAASNQLVEAVQACILAAASEFDISRQQSLLKAASYGKAFSPDADPTEFVETAKKIRILNEVRKKEIGLPLTIQQYNRLTPEVLVGRLTMRNHHFLALKICELLKLKNERVLIHWACEKVRRMSTNLNSVSSDEEINRVIKKQLEPYGRVSYLAIAEAAYNVGRRRLATFILDKEQHTPGDQIPLLLKMNEEELALQKAINSEDTDLIYYTLISLESRISPSRDNIEPFYQTIHIHLEAANLLKIYYRNKVNASDRSILHNLLLYSKNYFEAGIAAANQSFIQTNAINKINYLKEASQLFGSSRDCAFYKTMTDEQIELNEYQKNIEMRCQTKRDFVGLSVSQTIKELIILGLTEPVEARWTEQEILKIVKKFKVPEKMLYYSKIRCYSERGDWAALSRLANEKKSPVGYKPFAECCMKYNRPESETERFIEKITILEDKFDLYMQIKMYKKAVEVASKLRDPNRLQEVARFAQDPVLERSIQEILQKI
eukprot:gene15328-20658_t